MPTAVQRKLLAAFAAIAIILIAIVALSLRVLGDSNNRVEALGSLTQQSAFYQTLANDDFTLRRAIAPRTGTADQFLSLGFITDANISAADSDVDVETILANAQAHVSARYDFTPASTDVHILDQINGYYLGLQLVMNNVLQFDGTGQTAEGQAIEAANVQDAANRINSLTSQLVSNAHRDTSTLIAENRRAYSDSQHLLIAPAGGSIVLALLLGYVLSRSITGPIKRMNTRLAEIASGDFSRHVEVTNRDELGTLALNLNRMNDELGLLYHDVQAASRHKSDFLASMSHELRTPLNAVIGFSQVLKQRMVGELNAKQEEYVDDILTSGQHLLSLINDALDMAKVEAGRMDLEPAVFSLPDALATAMVQIRERATRQGVTTAMRIDPSVGLIEADERKVKQILFNLLTNAVKFTPEGGRITLAAKVSGDDVKVSVSDTGVGISPEDQGRIFEEFIQVGAGGTTQEGTGLGLPLAKRLVELHGGRLTVQSDDGVGSTLTFTVPLSQSVVTAQAPSHPLEPGAAP